MNEPSSIGSASSQASKRLLLTESRVPVATLLFVTANVLDIIMTWMLPGTGAFPESNPLARLVLDHHGMSGMMVCQLALVAGIVMIADFIAIGTSGTAPALPGTGTAMVGAGVLSSAW